MEIKKELLLELLKSAYMQRWNDKLRPMDIVELDKQAHKMTIAYFLGKFHEHEKEFSWKAIIEGGLFEFLQRIVVTDLKPPIFSQIITDNRRYAALNEWVYAQLDPFIRPLGDAFGRAFRDYFAQTRRDINRKILGAAHLYATIWEFDIIRRENPNDWEIDEIKRDLEQKQAHYSDLRGFKVLSDHIRYQKFISLCGQLRFQARWARIHRVPRTSVLGHMLFVAILSYLFSLSLGFSARRCVNNYFTGLFHDLPEALTRDIISPVKRAVAGLDDFIKAFEHQEMQKVYQLLPEEGTWRSDLKMYTEHEFEDLKSDGEPSRDGRLVEAGDKIAAFIEAYEAIRNGSQDKELHKSLEDIRSTHRRRSDIPGLDLDAFFAQFDDVK